MNTENNLNSSSESENDVMSSSADNEFSKVLAKTLESSLENIDEMTLARLKKSRVNSLYYSFLGSKKWMSFGVAASLAILVALPVLWSDSNNNIENSVIADADLMSQEVPPPEQELDDIDMLIAMDDTDV
jgi:hypothetical protein